MNDLLQLWKEGIVLPTPTCSEGCRIRVILLGIICDTPAAHKLGGFGAHSHTKFCIRCWITQEQKADPQAFRRNGLLLTIFICAVQCEYVLGGFPKRTNQQHRDLADQYRVLRTKQARKDFASAHSTRWTELARLPYFDMCRMIVIDPMHNLFLGL